MYSEREHTSCVIAAPMLNVVGDLLQAFHLDGFEMVQILNDCNV